MEGWGGVGKGTGSGTRSRRVGKMRKIRGLDEEVDTVGHGRGW